MASIFVISTARITKLEIVVSHADALNLKFVLIVFPKFVSNVYRKCVSNFDFVMFA